ncbi:hypothetical protein [Virgibacillus salinus]|uniref:Sulfotransferase domain-containing protein n=1 Tax=Virgibacillus salinus TaxID=553311 RepID=A0A1H0YHE7_9BACI|nr:hypothetical protein [Virgibacillus salinus]SDQ14518.1 hypothetical protein SAMN05216231_0655 [Virgibacillus salinus]
MKRKIYLHVGFHKTATTFLQFNLFPNLKEVKLIRKSHAKELFRRVRLNKLSDEDIVDLRQKFDKKGSAKKPTLISYEGLTGSPFAQKKSKSAFNILEDLKRIFPEDLYDVNVIVGIRKQVDIMTSLYIEYLHQGGYKKEKVYFDELEKNGIFEHYLYNDYLNHVEQVFGNDYYVFIYENFKYEKEKYLLQLLNYMGVKKIPKYSNEPLNRSYGALQAKMARRLNTIFKTKKNPNGKIPETEIILKRKYSKKIVKKLMGREKKKIPISPRTFLQNKLSYKLHYKRYKLSDELRRKINDYYIDDNQMLAKREGIELPEYYLKS